MRRVEEGRLKWIKLWDGELIIPVSFKSHLGWNHIFSSGAMPFDNFLALDAFQGLMQKFFLKTVIVRDKE